MVVEEAWFDTKQGNLTLRGTSQDNSSIPFILWAFLYSNLNVSVPVNLAIHDQIKMEWGLNPSQKFFSR